MQRLVIRYQLVSFDIRKGESVPVCDASVMPEKSRRANHWLLTPLYDNSHLIIIITCNDSCTVMNHNNNNISFPVRKYQRSGQRRRLYMRISRLIM